MSGMEWNKIFAAVLVAGITASLSGFIAHKLSHAEELEKFSYNIEVAQAASTTGEAMKEEGPEPILSLIAGADLARGEKLSKACAACHTFTRGGPNGAGPNLYGVVGRGKASVSGFGYSEALTSMSGMPWGYDELNKFLWKPKWYAPNTKMNFIGVKKAEDRAALIAWLRTLSDSPAALPVAMEAVPPQEESAAPAIQEAAPETTPEGAPETVPENMPDVTPEETPDAQPEAEAPAAQ